MSVTTVRSTKARRAWIGSGARMLLPIVLSLPLGCAMFHRPSAPPAMLEVTVTNDVKPPTPLVVYLGASDRRQVRLGRVEPDSQRTLVLPAQVAEGDYVLVGRDEGGRELVRQFVSLSTGEQRLVWQPGTHSVSTRYLR